MVTLYKNDNVKNTSEGQTAYCELRGLSTDTKPTEINGYKIGNGTTFMEIDTGSVFVFDEDNQEWNEV